MPKLDATHLFSRLVIRLEQLEAGEEIAAKELRSLLTTKQLKELDDAWKKQQELRKGKRARTPEEEKALGWKTKREVRIEVFKDAIAAADENIELEFDKLQIKAVRRQMRIYFEALDDAQKMGKDMTEAKNYANNKLTQAGLQRMDYKERLAADIKRTREVQKYLSLSKFSKTWGERDCLLKSTVFDRLIGRLDMLRNVKNPAFYKTPSQTNSTALRFTSSLVVM